MASAFRNHRHFRDGLIKVIGLPASVDWRILVRPAVSITRPGGRKKDVPDIALFSVAAATICLIENKIFAEEGWEQTKRYADNEFRGRLIDYISSTNPFSSVDVTFCFRFLTLDGTGASSEEFEALSYADLVKAIPVSLGKSKVEILLVELRERVLEYTKWPRPSDERPLLDYLKEAPRSEEHTSELQSH